MPQSSNDVPIKLHLSLNVGNLERSRAFYEAFLGTPPHKERPGYVNFDVSQPPLKLALNELPGKVGKGSLNHLGFQVGTHDQLYAARTRLQEAGLATFDETDTTCCYARQDKIWVHDPDGNAWEVYVLTDDLLDDHDHDHEGEPLTPSSGTTAQFIPPSALQEQPRVSSGVTCCHAEKRSGS